MLKNYYNSCQKKIEKYKENKTTLRFLSLLKHRDELIIEFEEKIQKNNKIILETTKEIKTFKSCKEKYLNIYLDLLNLNLLKEAHYPFFQLIQDKMYLQTYGMYLDMEKFIVNNLIGRFNDYNNERGFIKSLIFCLYKNWRVKNITPYGKYMTFTDKSLSNRKFIHLAREKFRKEFRYWIWSENKQSYFLTNLNQKSGLKEVYNKDYEIDRFISNDNTILIGYIKDLMKRNATNSEVSFSTSTMNYQYHIYLALVTFSGRTFVYIGKASENTRYRWGYRSGHLFNIFHFLANNGEHNFPQQLIDLWFLYFGPKNVMVCTLLTNVLQKNFNDYENAYRLFFIKNKDILQIDGVLNENLTVNTTSSESANILKTIENGFTSFCIENFSNVSQK